MANADLKYSRALDLDDLIELKAAVTQRLHDYYAAAIGAGAAPALAFTTATETLPGACALLEAAATLKLIELLQHQHQESQFTRKFGK